MFFAEKIEKLKMTTDRDEKAASVIGASVDFSIFQLFLNCYERD